MQDFISSTVVLPCQVRFRVFPVQWILKAQQTTNSHRNFEKEKPPVSANNEPSSLISSDLPENGEEPRTKRLHIP